MTDTDFFGQLPWKSRSDGVSFLWFGTWLLLNGLHSDADLLLKGNLVSDEDYAVFQKELLEVSDPMIFSDGVWALVNYSGEEVADVLLELSLKNSKAEYLYQYGARWRDYLDWDIALSPVAYVAEFHSMFVGLVESPEVPNEQVPGYVFHMYLQAKKLRRESVPVLTFKTIWRYRYCYPVIRFLRRDGQLGFAKFELILLPLLRMHVAVLVLLLKFGRQLKAR